MTQENQTSLIGDGYHFTESCFLCKEYSDPVPYDHVDRIRITLGTRSCAINFRTPEGKKRNTSVTLASAAHGDALTALLQRAMPAGVVRTHSETVWEAVSGWVTLALGLEALIAVVIAIGMWGGSVTVPIIIIPLLMIGRFLGTEVLVVIGAAILAVCVIGAILSLAKRKTVWEIKRPTI